MKVEKHVNKSDRDISMLKLRDILRLVIGNTFEVFFIKDNIFLPVVFSCITAIKRDIG